ncbi:MAG: biotin--[acetyl-CoA-carboxylase] ligase [Chloroflexi bacterium]|nr:biotin--[acetyl-CoA-carboxylase] ligase [Chloroflexota bacterium]
MDRFSVASFESALAPGAVIGGNLVYRRVVVSTMDVARELATAGEPHGTLVLAEEQTAGRGRRGRSFQSPAGGNLYFTLVLRLPVDVHRRLPLIVPLAVANACREEGADALIKWPNDIWVGRRKLSGMLIDAELAPEGPIAFPGIGINVNSDPSTLPGLADVATSLRNELGRDVDREALLARVCRELETWLAAPPKTVTAAYRALSLVIGKPVVVHPTGGEPYEAVASAIAPDGALVVTLPGGRLESVVAADVSVRPVAV